MSGNEIREKIVANNKRIESLLDKATFTLNKDVMALREENKHLQDICDHKYDETGYCIYCDKEVD